MRALRLSALLAVGALSMGLTGCLGSPITSPQEPVLTAAPQTPSPVEPSPEVTMRPVPDGVDCAGQSLTVDSNWDGAPVTGSCPLVEINGAGLVVDLAAAEVDRVILRGDRISVVGGGVGSVTIGGQDNTVDATSVGALDIAGDRNRIEVVGEVGAVVVGGNDNAVTAGSLGAVASAGERNQIRSR